MDGLIKTATIRSLDPTAILSLLVTFKTAFDSKPIGKGATMRSFPRFIREPYNVALSQRVTADNK